MKCNPKVPFVGLFIVLLIAGSVLPALAQEERIRAKIGIMIRSGDATARAKSLDRLKANDLIRIYVHPEKTSHVYVIHSDRRQANLLNMVEQRVQSSTLVMPSLQEFYQVNGESPKELFSIIISPGELPEILALFKSGNAPHAKWAAVEKVLIEKGRIDLSQKTEKPFSITGNVRSLVKPADQDPFVSSLQIFSGNALLVKKYEFSVKKE